MRSCKLLSLVVLLAGPAWSAHAQSSFVDLSTPMTGKSIYVFDADGTPVERGVPLFKIQNEIDPHGSARPPETAASGVEGATGSPDRCGGSSYGATSCVNGRPKVHFVGSYQRRDGTVVQSHFRSMGRRR